MDELNRDLADGMLGWDQADRAMSGDLTGAYRDEAARELLSRTGPDRRAGPAPTRALIIVAAMALVILILVAVG